jgi:hypothetical protein
MKSITMTVIGLCLLTHCTFAQENILKNGDFSKGKMGWKMKPGVRIREIPDPNNTINRFVEVSLDKSENQTLWTAFDIKSKTKAVKVGLRVKPGAGYASAIPDSNQLTVRITRPNKGSTFTGWKIDANKGDWQNFDWDFSSFEGERDFTFSIEFHPGTGTVWLDDVVITEI